MKVKLRIELNVEVEANLSYYEKLLDNQEDVLKAVFPNYDTKLIGFHMDFISHAEKERVKNLLNL